MRVDNKSEGAIPRQPGVLHGCGGKAVDFRFRVVRILAALVLCAVAAISSQGQTITGDISGIVKDQQGAVVTSATVKAINTDTGLTKSVKVTGEGTFRIRFLPVGNYTVEASAPGFEKFVQKDLAVTVDQTDNVNIVLAIGSQDITVVVTESQPLVETTTASLGRTVSSDEIENLPLVNDNAYAEISLTAGVMSNSVTGDSSIAMGTPNFVNGVPSTQVQVNGSMDNGVPSVSFYMDGGINMTGLRNYGNPIPNSDALDQFRIETTNYSAQYGRMSGAVVTVVTKSGTNKFHGSLHEYLRNESFNANNWNSPTRTPYHRNQYAGTVGGPIRKDKAFFFVDYAGLRQKIGTSVVGTTPTANERLGDFTADNITVYTPGTKTQVVGTNDSKNCGVPTPNCIPKSLLDAAASNLISKYIPLPNTYTYSTGGGEYRGYFIGPLDEDEFLAKYNETLSDRHRIGAGFFFVNTLQDIFGYGGLPYSTNEASAHQYNVNLYDSYTVNPTMINQAWLTMTRVNGSRVNLPAVGMDDFGSTYTTQGPRALPELVLTGEVSAGGALAGPISDTTFYSLRDMVTKSHGKHNLDIGGEFSLEKDVMYANDYNFGIFTYNVSAPTTTGNVLSDFITGQVYSMRQDTPYRTDMSDWYYALYAQDNYRILRNLTLDLGIRWDVETTPVDAHDQMATFMPGEVSTRVPAAPKGMLFPGDRGIYRGIVPTRFHHISPRMGVSWDPFGDGKTAVRAAFGIFYGAVSINEWSQPTNSQPFAVAQTFNSIKSFSDVYGNPASFPNGDPFPYTFTPSNPRFLPAAGIEVIAPNFQWPLAYQMNFAIQRELPKRISLAAAYVGTLSHHLPFMTDLNYAAYAPGATTSQTSINQRRPYDPGVLGQVLELESNERANYHSLQVTARRPLSHNFTVSGFYVWSHALQSVDTTCYANSYAQDYDNLWEEKGPMDVDRLNMASVSGIWNLNYYKGYRSIFKQVINGWTLSSIGTFYSGLPFTVTTGANNNSDSNNQNRPDLVPGVSPFLDPHRPRMVARQEWFNPKAFTANGPGVTGGIGPGGADGNSPRNYLRAPGYRDIDIALRRDFKFERRYDFQIRFDSTNTFNMVSLGTPSAVLSSPSQIGGIFAAHTPRLMQIGGRLTF